MVYSNLFNAKEDKNERTEEQKRHKTHRKQIIKWSITTLNINGLNLLIREAWVVQS